MGKGNGYWKLDKGSGRWIWVEVHAKEKIDFVRRGIRVGKKLYDPTPHYRTSGRKTET